MGLSACVAGEGEGGIWVREAREVSRPNSLPLSTATQPTGSGPVY